MKRDGCLALTALLVINVASAFCERLLQEATNAHYVVAKPMALVCWCGALCVVVTTMVFKAQEASSARVFLLLAIALSLVGWGYRFYSMMCEGCLRAG